MENIEVVVDWGDAMGRRRSGVGVLKRMMRTMGSPSDGGEDMMQGLTWCPNRSLDFCPQEVYHL